MKAITREEKIISGENLTPITRKEMFLAKAAGQNIQTPTPITREEIFLSKITGGGGSVEGTAIPVGEKVEKIYFNTNLSIEETNAYLSQLTYVEGITNYPCYIVFANSKGFGIGIEKQDEETYRIFHLSFKSNGEMWFTTYFRGQWFTLVTEQKYGEEYYTQLDPTLAIIPSAIFSDIDGGDLGSSLNDFDGFPIGAENEKIKNVLSITPFGASGTNEPTAYTVSSIDELPTNAKEGSLAMVNETVILDGAGTWVFDYELPNLEESFNAWENNNWTSPFEIQFANNGTNFIGFVVGTQGSSSWGIYQLSFEADTYNQVAYTHNPSGNYGITHGWNTPNSQTIEVSYADREAQQWLEAHATQTVKDEESADVITSFYIFENGKWVLVEGCDGSTSTNPTAYTVSSVDELPTNAVDGSMAIVENNGLLGTWALQLYYASDERTEDFYGTFYFDFYQNLLIKGDGFYGFRYDAMAVEDIGYPYISFLYEGERLADGIYDDGIAPPMNYIAITKEPTDANARNFINTYLIRIGSGKGIYTHENGEWVYKGEVA